LGVSSISVAAFLGALASLLLVYGLAMARKSFSPSLLLLAGVAMSFFFWSLILFTQSMSNFTESFRILRWMTGGVEAVGYGGVLTALLGGPFFIGLLLRRPVGGSSFS